MSGREKRTRTSRIGEEVFVLNKDSPEKLEGLHRIFEAAYDGSSISETVESIASNLSPFLFALGNAYERGILNGHINKMPQRTRAERNKEFPFDLYQDNPTVLEQLHWAFEWRYKHGSLDC